MTLRVNNGSYKICYLPFYWLVYDQKNKYLVKKQCPITLALCSHKTLDIPYHTFIILYSKYVSTIFLTREAGAICILLTTVFLSLVPHNASHVASAQKYIHDKRMCEWLSQNVSKLKGPSSQLSPLSLGANYWHDYDILNSHFQYSQK